MRKLRFTIGGIMAVVSVLAVGFAALRNADEVWAGAMFLLTCGVLALAIVGAVCRRGGERAWWLGFALFGWGYLFLAFWPSESLPGLPTLKLVDWLQSLFVKPAAVQDPFATSVAGAFGGGFPSAGPPNAQIGHCLWALLFALIGGTLSRALFGSREDRTESLEPIAPTMRTTMARSPANRWLRTAVLVLVAAVVVTSVAALGTGTSAGAWAGVAFLLTCGLLGVTILVALFGRGRQREVGMGAALFGIGYLLLTFGFASGWPRPDLATDPLLRAIRPWFPVLPRGIAASNAIILDLLEFPVPMHFPNETPIDDVLKHIQQATSFKGAPGIPFYVDPLGLQEAERSLNSTVQIDLEGVPLKTTLRLCLKQLGLDYTVKDGYLLITSEDSIVKNVEDPFLIVGHCWFALIAAGLGGLLAPRIAAGRRVVEAAPSA